MRRWSFESVEWGRAVANVHRALVGMGAASGSSSRFDPYFVLPDLPTVSEELKTRFAASVTRNRQIRTIALQHFSDEAAVERYVRNGSVGVSGHLLVVGGSSNQGNLSLTTPQAIALLKNVMTDCKIWATADPNDNCSVESVKQKLEAGVTGIITQPFLSSRAAETFEAYPEEQSVSYAAGVAFPTSLKSLLFWQKLVAVPDLADDSLFRDHMRYYERPNDTVQARSSLQWVKTEIVRLKQFRKLKGVHYMPLHNTRDLLTVVEEERAATTFATRLD